MKNMLLAAIVGAVLILGIMVVPLTITQTAFAQSKRLTCDTTKDCNIIIRRLSVGDDLIIQFKASQPPGGTGGGGGGTVPGAAVDQQARDDITNLKSVDVQHGTDIASLQAENAALKNQTAALESQNVALKDNLTATNGMILVQTQAIAELQSAVKNITEANPFVNITIPGQNESQSGQGEQPTTPSEGNETNGTPGAGENTTTTPPITGEGGNITLPGNNETTTSPPAGNESNAPVVSNPICLPDNPDPQCVTNPPNNQTPNGNVSVTNPICLPNDTTCVTAPNQPINITNSNVSIQNPICDETHPCITTGESNVTLPTDNGSGNIIIENGTTNVTNDAK